MDPLNSVLERAGANFVLEHAGARIYDPVKAHEYYLRTRELKGRRSSSELKTKKKREGWSYVQNTVKELQRTELKSASSTSKADIERLRSGAKEYRKALSDKIKGIIEQITSDVKSQIDSLPKNLSKEDRAAAIADIQAKANVNRESNKVANRAEVQKVVSDLKAAIDNARTKYKEKTAAIKAKYDSKLQSEFDALKTGAE